MLYERPYYYLLSHIIIGFVAVWYPSIGILGVLYQVLQYIFGIRFFILEMKIRNKNSFYHTILKLAEISIGYILGRVTKRYVSSIF